MRDFSDPFHVRIHYTIIPIRELASHYIVVGSGRHTHRVVCVLGTTHRSLTNYTSPPISRKSSHYLTIVHHYTNIAQ